MVQTIQEVEGSWSFLVAWLRTLACYDKNFQARNVSGDFIEKACSTPLFMCLPCQPPGQPVQTQEPPKAAWPKWMSGDMQSIGDSWNFLTALTVGGLTSFSTWSYSTSLQQVSLKSSQTTSSIRRAIKPTLPLVTSLSVLIQVGSLKLQDEYEGKEHILLKGQEPVEQARALSFAAPCLFVWKISITLITFSVYSQLLTDGPAGFMGYSTVSCAPCLKSWFQIAAASVASVASAKVGSTATWSGGRSSNQCEALMIHRPTEELCRFWCLVLRWSDFPLPDEDGAIVQRGSARWVC